MYSYRNHIRGIVDEFVSNSIKAKATKIDVKIEVAGDYITITVKDDGTGIKPEQLAELEEQLYHQFTIIRGRLTCQIKNKLTS